MESATRNWLEVANNCYSSYKQNDLGWVLYGLVRAHKPVVCVELGVLEGYSAIFTAAGLKDNGFGYLGAYDLWEDYPYRHVTQKDTQDRLKTTGVAGYVTLDYHDAHNVPGLYGECEIDFLHIDLGNNGSTFRWAMETFRPLLSEEGIIIFEGGSKERDQCDWMLQYEKPPIRTVLENETLMKDWDWSVIKPYPSMTIMRLK